MKDFLIDSLNSLNSYRDLIQDVNNGISPISVYGMGSENLGHILYGLNNHLNKKMLLIVDNDKKAKDTYEDLINLGHSHVYLFSKKEILFYDIDASSLDNSKERLNSLANLISDKNNITITTMEAMCDKIISKAIFKEAILNIQYGKNIDLNKVLKDLVILGYKRVPMVEGVGQFSLRGGIVDIFPPDSSYPYRIELFDDEVDSIRSFDYLSQRSIETIKMINIPPVEEILILDKYKDDIKRNLKKDIEGFNRNEKAKEKFSKYLDLLEDGNFVTNRNMIIPYIPKEYLASILDFIDRETLVLIDEPGRVRLSYKKAQENMNFQYTDLLEVGEIMPTHFDLRWSFNDLIKNIKAKKVITFNNLLKSDKDFSSKSIHNFSIKSNVNYHNKIDMLAEDLKHLQYRGYKIIIFSGTEDRGIRLEETLQSFDIISSYYNHRDKEIKSGQIFITPGSISHGFEYSAIKYIVISEKEIYGSQKKKLIRSKKKKGEKIVNLNDLEIGSYIVHENHGIGRYEGIEQLEVQGIKKDYLMIRYKGEDKLYIPIDQMNLIQKYVGSDNNKPRISKLNSGEWQRTKVRAKKAVENMAEDLLNLYAKRENLNGYSFASDTIWQRQFEDSFPYEDTEGQVTSSQEIKNDMEDIKPMDRLLCGDVGYGKTEVALRAAFKALMDGKQVAILVPTTILAQQHYNTMIDRFGEFPIISGMLSRFRSQKQQNKIIDGLKVGTIDIVVGTHRLLSKDVSFKNLGLLIIDEEQRFGVKHKEKLKQLKENVDVLTLTATPIPRTLHMSLIGIRDMSVIEDPPAERYPIQTYVLEYNPQMVREAILKEVSRGGQVYFVYNRVETIEKIALELRKLVPEARFSIGHGQMGERQLEKVMLDFIKHENDVLICTTIIETGLDIPNVNTMIVYDADKMGLSQLYQLRGRVGRSTKIAYGYFTYEKDKVLTEVAEKRLRAIKEFTEFGSGFKIAMRDLEIRGAGNLLGVEQHGHIGAIGYDLYVKFLGEAIRRLKGEEVIEEIDTTIDINIDGFIPLDYIESEDLKLEAYKKIAGISNLEDYDELLDELIDRFGDIPKVVENLMDISYIKALSGKNGIKEISEINKELKIDLVSVDWVSPELIHSLSTEHGNALSFDLSSTPNLRLVYRGEKVKVLKNLIENMDRIKKIK